MPWEKPEMVEVTVQGAHGWSTLEGPSTSLSHQNELSVLEAESHQHRMAIQDSITSGKGTEVAYAHHVKNYEDWWLRDQNQ